MDKTNNQYQIVNGNVIIEFNMIQYFAGNYNEKEIGNNFERRSYMLNDSEVAYDAIRSFIKRSIVQLESGKKVIFTLDDGSKVIEFDKISDFREWANNFFALSKYKSIKINIIDIEFER